MFYQIISGVVIVTFSIGMPCGLVVMMLCRIEDYGSGTDSDRFVARRVADELKIEDSVAADAIRDITTGREYSWPSRVPGELVQTSLLFLGGGRHVSSFLLCAYPRCSRSLVDKH